jgi:hypothetical protein
VGGVVVGGGGGGGGGPPLSRSWPAGNPHRGQSHVSGIAASLAKLGTVSCRLQHQNETRTRGAASPRSASPIGPAPTRLPRIALPLLTAHPLPHGLLGHDPLNLGVREEIADLTATSVSG